METNIITKTQNESLKSAICRDFHSSCKNKSELKVGLEIERLPVYKNTHKAVSYFGSNGMYRLLRQVAYNDGWDYITDLNFVNGIKKGNTTITLEPGGQLEYSLEPQKNITQIKQELENLDKKIKPILDFLGISLLEYPITPLTNGLDIEIIPKRRYQTMAKYMNGERCYSMMRETAGIQVSIDYTDELDAMRKYKVAMMLSPFATAIFANSPIRCGKPTGYKSTRALAWLKTDETRCGLVSDKLFNKNLTFSFNDYIEKIFQVPLLFLQRDNNIIEIGGKINFETFYKNGYNKLTPTKEDYNLHASLFFPEVRLKNIIEIRNQDAQQENLKYAVPTLFKGILYNQDAQHEILELMKNISYEDFMTLRREVPKSALNTKIGNKKLVEYAKLILNIAYNSIKNMKEEEEKYLEPIMQLTYDGLCPADLILKNWHNSKNKLDTLIENVRIK